MSIGADFAVLFTRDLARLARQLDAFDDAHLWQVTTGVTNSAGNLILHLSGNLRDFIGRQIGGVDYTRDRPREFSTTNVPRAELVADVAGLCALVPGVLEATGDAKWDEIFPTNVLGTPMTNQRFVVHLYGHLNYHLGQIDYLRRMLTGEGALPGPGPAPTQTQAPTQAR